jgi:uncharacterized membrane protein
MELQLEHPVFLWILAGAVPLLVWAALRSYALAPNWKRIASLALRALALSFVVLALTRPIWRLSRPDQTVVFALDVSDSVAPEALREASEWIAKASTELAAHQRAALVLFGGRAKVARELAREPIAFTGEIADAVFHRSLKDATKRKIVEVERDLGSDGAQTKLAEARARLAALEAKENEIATAETNVREALRLARSLLPEDSRRRVVLLSDGNWTRDDPEAELAFLERAGITVDARSVHRGDTEEVIAERLLAPGQVRIREPVELELHVSSGKARTATLKLYRDQFLLKTDTVELNAGRNLIRIPKQELDEGFHEFQAIVEAADDPTPENNAARAVVVVAGRPTVLLIEGREQDGRYLEQALRDEDIQIEVRPALGFPAELNELLTFDVLIVSDVPATDLHTSQLDAVKRYVKDFGGGLIMLGGEKSFGLGGYYRTPVEDALPVRMPIKKTIEKPNLAMVLVLDRSGSMSGQKLSLAKEAAIASVEVLKPRDEIGVVCFDDYPDWVVELQPAGNREDIKNQVSRVAVGGGTHIYKGLFWAYEALRDSTAKLKHAIVLTDGHTTGTREEHIDLVSRMSAEQMTVSTVGIGDADQALLTAMADMGQGEAYFTNDFGNLPQIFTKETLRASKSMLVEEPFVPLPTGRDDQMLKGVELADAPLLMGYIATTPKETASVLLVSDHGDPILAHWNYGLGRSVAFTSDAKNRWATDWISWPQFGKFWAQVVRSVMSTGTTSALQQTADVRLEKGEVKFDLDTRDREGRFLDEVHPEVAIVSSSGEAKTLDAQHVAPGLFQTRFPLETYGDFVRLRVTSRLGEQVVGLRNYAVVESYPPEYRAAAANDAFLQHAADATGGRREPPIAEAFTFDGEPARGLLDLWRWCVLLAGLLLPLDIALRRLG